MSPLAVFLLSSAVFWTVVIAAAVGVVVVLKKRGFFTRAKADASATLTQAATDAVTKISK